MPSKFDVATKPLNKAKPCVVHLIRDDGSTEWFEGCKPGQLLEIKSGDQKCYLNLDYHKLLNMNVQTPEDEFLYYKDMFNSISVERQTYYEKHDKLQLELSKELDKITSSNMPVTKMDKKVGNTNSIYTKRINSLTGKYVKLNKNKIRNFGTASKPILGFVCYEKEFNALPFKAEHDSKAITQWMDDILKNKKDFQAQRTEAWGKTLLYVLLGLGLIAFIFFKWGAPMLEKANEPTEVVATFGILIPIIKGEWFKWLKRRSLRNMVHL